MRKKLLVFAALALVYCYVSFHRVTLAVIGDLLAEQFHLGPAQLGLLGGVLLYCYALLQLPSGLFADNVGPKRTILISLVLSAVGSLVFAAAWDFTTAIAGRILIGAGIACIYLSLIKILSVWFNENEFGTVLGILMSLGMLGNMLATSPLALSVNFMGWRLSYVLVAVLTLGLFVLVRYRVQNAPDGGNAAGESEASGMLAQVQNSKPKVSFLRTTWTLMTNRSYLMLVIFMIAGSSLQGFQSLWAGPFLSRSYGFSLLEVGNALLWYSLGGICGPPLWGLLSDKIVKSRKRILVWSSILSIIVWFIPSFFPLAVPRDVVHYLLFAMGMAGGGGVLTHAMVRESFSFEILGIAVGIINFFTFLGGAAFTQLMGHLVALFPQKDGAYPLIAYQTTLMLIFAMWVVRLFSLMLTEEHQKAPATAPVPQEASSAVS